MESKLQTRYTITAYRNALSLRDNFDYGSAEWKTATSNIDEILENGVKNGNDRLAMEVIDILESLYDCLGCTVDPNTGEIDANVRAEIETDIDYYTALLKENGFSKLYDRFSEYFTEP